jgi:hypothetical protein
MKTDKESLEMIQAIKQLLRYEDGKLYWKESRGRRVKSGDRAGSKKDHRGYRQIRAKGKKYQEHRVVWVLCFGSFPNGEIDHINGVKDDNRIENLREVTRSGNSQAFRSKSKNNSSRFRGVHWHKGSEKWMAQIGITGVTTYIGTFDCEIEAAKAYDRAAIEHSFDVQALNFKPEP